ncbi:MAG: hypothetical protein ACD_32C00110G0007 [uncultured bacterium]|uniref:Glycosyltransferase RgtA/B/C/D-like domain-containing protein n=1 Tax=Candidatus Daviesbacteria bacterium GW2011_GWC2_40_12 TaxID=1618431 RepID=A0A0G0TXC5_9BACT|nr:MAG: hypothetical protein ACD_32C00110G0007 [uncultured bacterium]KKR17213.1 MAG: hypothetical protein UT45_C0002G0042 [Candidatus Daviesbacteria bacterium GW2011_GWA2_39_33]KKR42612.1 MAG: hypothetical protein UT77_C0001G0063 [Candidatus Daviesbacteria bacterium GW2011_GWC2_40_12]OGE21287.1 MAG: hypothetical protein A2778_03920 [Candidatus Daviesbacteria bacterium RIFCSPHIGHO2_01_FULL_40_24]OGE30195.1 MAG: hypothetical protein A3C29_02200 [Candidatus Daviesbacteria bacterium RIFCSPHIGHO2_02
MKKILLLFLLLLVPILFVPSAFAQNKSFISIINPIRGQDFWDIKEQKPETAVAGQITILNNFNLVATWLLRFDALDDKNIINILNERPKDEKGLFLEITPTWTTQAKIEYRKSDSWHAAGSAFLTGYELNERKKLIDAAFEKFENTFGYYPSSVGAWWIDSYSLSYMQEKYAVSSALIVSDQYSTDNYQIWGQYFSTPYYPAKNNALHPAKSLENKLDVVMVQWAQRDPVNSYGNGVTESTYSVQANDYMDYHSLGVDYFSKLIDIYTKQKFNRFNHLVVGLENSYEWNKYLGEYKNQIEVLRKKSDSGQLAVVSMKDFASWYKSAFRELSPKQLIVADDPLGSFKKVVWFMNPYYRAGWFYNTDGSVFRDIRQYIEGEEEICFKKSCKEVNFATFATRVLDEVSFGHKWIIDEGKISEFEVSEKDDSFVLSYVNEAGKDREIEFLPRDLRVNGKVSSIDGAILDAIKQDTLISKEKKEFPDKEFNWTISGVLSKTIRFLLFLIFICVVPGFVVTNKLLEKNDSTLRRIFLALTVGGVLLTIIFYITSLLNLRFLIFVYIFTALLLFFRMQRSSFSKIKLGKNWDKLNIITMLIVISGSLFQNIPSFKNGLVFSFGMGLWGPNTHDGIWHISLINQLLRGIPVENPIYAGTILKNYHFFYDLLIAATAYFTKIPIIDLVFRFYPVLFSLFLGIGSYHLVMKLFLGRMGVVKTKVAAILSLFFIYFAGSFGWIAEYLRGKTFGGESAFWANQSISFNLNPPFAISLIIIIAFLNLLLNRKTMGSRMGIFVSTLLLGSLVGFKAYAAVLAISSLLFISLINIFKKEYSYLLISAFSLFFSFFVFLFNFQSNAQLMIFSPFWLIHSMIDSPDRVGWTKLSIARIAGLETKNWFKFLSVEAISLLIFIAGNLGVRILSLGSLVKIKDIVKDNNLLFILVFTILSFLIPIFFIQSGNPWNVIQFSYYGLYVTALATGPILAYLIFRLPKLLSFLIILGVLVLTPINSVTTATYYLGFLPHGRIDNKELEALNFLFKQEYGTVLTYPYDRRLQQKISEPWPLFAYDSTAYVAALSGKAVFLEDEGQNQILLTDYKRRLIAAKDFFQSNFLDGNTFLENNKIKYIYIPKAFKIRMEGSSLSVKNIFENDEVIIYSVI